jgi:hypothetical protein
MWTQGSTGGEDNLGLGVWAGSFVRGFFVESGLGVVGSETSLGVGAEAGRARISLSLGLGFGFGGCGVWGSRIRDFAAEGPSGC